MFSDDATAGDALERIALMVGTFSKAAPEDFYAGHRARQDAYYRLSVKAANAGDAYLATLAMWASDLSALQAIMWERVFTTAPGPEQQYLIATNAISTAMSQQGVRSNPGESAQQAIINLRTALPSALEPEVFAALQTRLSDSTHLRMLAASDAESPTKTVRDHLGNAAPSAFIKDRLDSARDLMTLASNAQGSGDALTAASCAYQAVMLLLDAYLIHVSVALGERSIASAVLRWKLLCDEVAAMGSLPLDPSLAISKVLSVVQTNLGPLEVTRVREFAAANGFTLP
jgi:hypothetical protein